MHPITIVTLAIGADFCKALAPCLDGKKAYAERHGYDYIQAGEEVWDRSRPIPWSKIPLLLGLLAKIPEGALLWLSDADVLITNPELRLEDHVVPLLPAHKDMLMCIDACGHLNSGNLLMRNSPWLRAYWQKVWEQEDLIYHIWWENAGMIKVLEMFPEDLAHVEITSEHRRFNAYLQGLEGQPLWMPGDFLVHFAGVYNVETIRRLVDAIQSRKVPRLSMFDPKKIEFLNIE